MSPVKNIQLRIGRYSLNKEKKKLKRKTISCNLASAVSVGILYNATTRENGELIKNLLISLKQLKKDVLALGYVNLKDSSDVFKPHINYAYFDNKCLSKTKIPKSIDVNSFIEKPFNLLLDLNLDDDFPLEYISTLSHATFKVGSTGSYRDEVCDLTINISEKKELKYLVNQMLHYLNLIKH